MKLKLVKHYLHFAIGTIIDPDPVVSDMLLKRGVAERVQDRPEVETAALRTAPAKGKLERRR